MSVVIQVLSNTAPRGTLTLTFASNYSQVTGSSLKTKIQNGIGIPVREQNLTFNGKLIQDGDNLQRMGIANGCVVHLDRNVQTTSASVAAMPQSAVVYPKGVTRQQAATAVSPITSSTPPQAAFPLGSSRINSPIASTAANTAATASHTQRRTPSPVIRNPPPVLPGMAHGVVVVPANSMASAGQFTPPINMTHGSVVPPASSPDIMYGMMPSGEHPIHPHDPYCQTAVEFMGGNGNRYFGSSASGVRNAASPLRGPQTFPFSSGPELTGPFAPVFLDRSQMDSMRAQRYPTDTIQFPQSPIPTHMNGITMTAPSVAFVPSSQNVNGGETLHFIATTGIGNPVAQPIGPTGVLSPTRPVPYANTPASPVHMSRSLSNSEVSQIGSSTVVRKPASYIHNEQGSLYQSPTSAGKTIVPEIVIPTVDLEDGPIDFQAIKQQREHQQRIKREHEAIRQSRDLEFARTRKELEEVKIQSEIEISMAEREVQQKMENIERLHRKHRRAEEYIGRITQDRDEERKLEAEAARQLDANIAALDEHAEGARQAELDQIRAKLRRHTELQTQLAAERAQAEVVRKEHSHYIREAESALHNKVEDLLGRESWLERELIDIEERKRAMEEMKDSGTLPRKQRPPLSDIRNTNRNNGRGLPLYDDDLDVSKPSNKSWDERCWEESGLPTRGRMPPPSSLHAGTWA